VKKDTKLGGERQEKLPLKAAAAIPAQKQKAFQTKMSPSPALLQPGYGMFDDGGLPIPESYGLDRLVAMVRDPLCIFCYWELSGQALPELRKRLGPEMLPACTWALRLYRLKDYVAEDVEIQETANNWYLRLSSPGKHQVELALLSPGGDWFSLLVSQVVETPPLDGLYSGDLDPRSQERTSPAARPASSSLAPSFASAGRLGNRSPENSPGKTLLPNFKIKLPRRLVGIAAPSATAWPQLHG
jgi:hypothetical protein